MDAIRRNAGYLGVFTLRLLQICDRNVSRQSGVVMAPLPQSWPSYSGAVPPLRRLSHAGRLVGHDPDALVPAQIMSRVAFIFVSLDEGQYRRRHCAATRCRASQGLA
jgi:hypothetical protein